jgi:hypothetical protein
MLSGRLGLEKARIPHADRHGLIWLEPARCGRRLSPLRNGRRRSRRRGLSDFATSGLGRPARAGIERDARCTAIVGGDGRRGSSILHCAGSHAGHICRDESASGSSGPIPKAAWTWRAPCTAAASGKSCARARSKCCVGKRARASSAAISSRRSVGASIGAVGTTTAKTRR